MMDFPPAPIEGEEHTEETRTWVWATDRWATRASVPKFPATTFCQINTATRVINAQGGGFETVVGGTGNTYEFTFVDERLDADYAVFVSTISALYPQTNTSSGGIVLSAAPGGGYSTREMTATGFTIAFGSTADATALNSTAEILVVSLEDADIGLETRWCTFDGTQASPVIHGNAGDFSSLVTPSAGIYDLTFTDPMPDANYGIIVGGSGPDPRYRASVEGLTTNGFPDATVNGFRMGSGQTWSASGGVKTDTAYVAAMAFTHGTATSSFLDAQWCVFNQAAIPDGVATSPTDGSPGLTITKTASNNSFIIDFGTAFATNTYGVFGMATNGLNMSSQVVQTSGDGAGPFTPNLKTKTRVRLSHGVTSEVTSGTSPSEWISVLIVGLK